MKFFTVFLLDVILSHLYSFNCCVIDVWILLVVVGLLIFFSCLFDFFFRFYRLGFWFCIILY